MIPFKKRFFLLRNLFSSFLSGLKSGKTTRFKIIVFSNFFNKTFSIVISKRHIIFTFLLVFGIVVLATFFFINLTERQLKLKQRLALYESYQSRIDELHNHGTRVVQYNENYEREIEEIFNHLGQVSAKKLWAGNIAGVSFSGEEREDNFFYGEAFLEVGKGWWSSTSDYFSGVLGFDSGLEMQQLVEIQEKSDRTRTTLQHLQEIETFFSLQAELRQHVPTGWPLIRKVGYKTSGYGPRFSPFTDDVEFHTGVDIAALPGTTVIATADGEVVFSGTRAGYGEVVKLAHKYGHTSLYAHNQNLLVRNGEKVKKGAPIAKLGNTGRSTGFHVHYETKLSGVYVDPWPYLVAEF